MQYFSFSFDLIIKFSILCVEPQKNATIMVIAFQIPVFVMEAGLIEIAQLTYWITILDLFRLM